MKVRVFEVGGAVRDSLMGVPSADVDFAVEAESFDAMLAHIVSMGLKVIPARIDREHLTIKALVPKGHPLRERTKDADFVLCREDGPSSDGRHPDWVKPGTIWHDLARRDLTVNAIAKSVSSLELIDPFNGIDDLERRVLRFVGEPMKRIREDGLRSLRAFRFSVTKGFTMTPETLAAVTSQDAAHAMRNVSEERRHAELEKMFNFDTLAALAAVESMGPALRAVLFAGGKLRLTSTLKKVR